MARLCMALLGVTMLLLLLTGAGVESRVFRGPSRQLHASVQATAVSAGGSTAISQSTGTGSANVSTTAVALDGGKAIADQSASSGLHSKIVISKGNYSTSVEHHEPSSWESATTCRFNPTGANSKADNNGRLWGWQDGASCVFKRAVVDLWDSAKPCPATLSPATKDKSGRLWGWSDQASCAFKHTATVSTAAIPNRKLLQGTAPNTAATAAPNSTADPAISVDAVEPTSPNTLAASKNTPTVATTVYGSGADAVTCKLISTPDGAGNTHTTLKCEKTPMATNATAPAMGANSATPATNTPVAPRPVNAANSTAPPPVIAANNASNNARVSTSNTGSSSLQVGLVVPDVRNTTATNAAPAASATLSSNTTALQPTNAIMVPTAPLPFNQDAAHSVVNRFGSTWEAAPVCEGKPNKRTSVQDTMGRLWWWGKGMSCAYRSATGGSIFYDGYVQVKWESSPACKGEATMINSMADAEGRLWGWMDTANGESCKFVAADGKPTMHEALLAAVIRVASVASTQLTP